MKTCILSLFTFICLAISSDKSFAQATSAEALLDSAVVLSEKGDSTGTAEALTKSTAALENEAKASNGDLKDKLLSKVSGLKSMIPLASGGKLQSGVLGKAVDAVKMLIGANRISSLLGKGESGLLGKGSNLASSLGLIKSGSSVLGSGTQSELSGLLGEATKLAGNVDKKGVAGKLAATASSKSLGSIVKLVGSAL
jgi:hypothetical protein